MPKSVHFNVLPCVVELGVLRVVLIQGLKRQGGIGVEAVRRVCVDHNRLKLCMLCYSSSAQQ